MFHKYKANYIPNYSFNNAGILVANIICKLIYFMNKKKNIR